MTAESNLPYFDKLIQSIEGKEKEFVDQFGFNIHWGYWEDPRHADVSKDGVVQATNALNAQLLNEVKLADGQRVLDVGCGFGGTITVINENHNNMSLVGVNIDERQLAVARRVVKAKDTNQIEFKQADACRLPFDNESFDNVLAVEAIFHFPSKRVFLSEAFRVLKPGGRLVFSDFVVYGPGAIFALIIVLLFGKALREVYGSTTGEPAYTAGVYKLVAKELRFRVQAMRDITKKTIPTYAWLKTFAKICEPLDPSWAKTMSKANRCLEILAKLGLLRYYVVAFQKPEDASGGRAP